MKLLKSAVIATTLTLSLASFSTTADVCLGMACMYNKMTAAEGIDATLAQVNEAQKAVNDKAGDKAVTTGMAISLAIM